MSTYHYTECGLDNVFIEGLDVVQDHGGEETIIIPAIGLLHRVIAEGIVTQGTKMSGRELRFLRSEMGYTQAKLAEILKVTLLTVGRWERDESPIKDAAEMLVRLMAVEVLELDITMGVGDVSERVTQEPRVDPIRIDGSDPAHYKIAA